MKVILTVGYASVAIDGLDTKAIEALTRARAVQDSWTGDSGKAWKYIADNVVVQIVPDANIVSPPIEDGQDLATVQALCDAAGVKLHVTEGYVQIDNKSMYRTVPTVDHAAWRAWESYVKETNKQ